MCSVLAEGVLASLFHLFLVFINTLIWHCMSLLLSHRFDIQSNPLGYVPECISLSHPYGYSLYRWWQPLISQRSSMSMGMWLSRRLRSIIPPSGMPSTVFIIDFLLLISLALISPGIQTFSSVISEWGRSRPWKSLMRLCSKWFLSRVF